MRAMSPLPELPGDRPDPLVPPRVGLDGRGEPHVARDARRLNGLAVAAAGAAATMALMLATGPHPAIVWGEGDTPGRQERLRLWFRALRDPSQFAARWRPPAQELVQQIGAPPPGP